MHIRIKEKIALWPRIEDFETCAIVPRIADGTVCITEQHWDARYCVKSNIVTVSEGKVKTIFFFTYIRRPSPCQTIY